MRASKSAKLITLVVAILLFAGVAAGVYFLTMKTDKPLQDPPSAQSNKNSAAASSLPEQPEAPAPSAQIEQGEGQPQAGSAVTALIDDSFVLLPGGTFTMGSPDSERQRNEDEAQHEVTLGAFYIDPYEVTQADYEAIIGTNPSHFKGVDLPVENITWYEAVAYCNALSASRGLTPVYTVDGDTVTWDRSANGYRLLTEAEWEYAARAGTSTVYNFGDQVHSDLCNFEGSYPYLIEENYVSHANPDVVTSRNRGETIAVNELAANSFGLYNMHGNVAEWCFDYYGEYGVSGDTDPAGASSGSLRINRGGSYNDFGKHLRSAYRSATNPIDPYRNLGLRIGRNAEGAGDIVTTTYSLHISIPENPRILVAYFSYSGNTEDAAQLIAQKTGADIVELTMTQPYSGNIYEVSQRDLNAGTRPALSIRVNNMDEYDVVLLGYPTWWATMPMPVFTFLESCDFTGKTIVSFSSHGGTMFGDSVSDLCKTVQGAYVGVGYEFNYSRSDSADISEWLAQNGVPER